MTRKHFSHIGLIFSLLALLTAVVQSLGVSFGAAVFPEFAATSWGYMVFTMLPMYLLAAPYCLILLRLKTTAVPPSRGVSLKQAATVFPIAVTLMYAGNLIGTMLNAVLGTLRGETISNDVAELVTHLDVLPVFVFVVVLAPIVEELLFRKFLIDAVYPYGELTAVLTSGLMFGLFHGNLYQFFYAAALGCLFAYIYCKTGRVRYTMVLHAVINFMGSIAAPWLLSGVDLQYPTMRELPRILMLMAYVGVVLGLAVLGLVLLILNRRRIKFLKADPSVKSGAAAALNLGMIVYAFICLILFIQNIF